MNEVSQIKLPEYTVSELSQVIKRTLEDTFAFVRVRGEISGLHFHTSGHVYFNLKDQGAVLKTVCWKGIASTFPFKLEEGLEVICTGKISTFHGNSSYQLIVNKIESAGLGALLAMLEKRKKKLEAEGLFDQARKKSLPSLPQVIGVVTSPTGAVIRDILHRIRERFPVHVIVWPVMVQGVDAASQIANAIIGFNQLPEKIPIPDLLIVARGGGSIEDLWSFNEEIVVRAVADSKIPIISAVGHETDTTLIDYVSDRRAPTPTAAAEMAVPVIADLLYRVGYLEVRCRSVLVNYIKSSESKIYQYHNKIMRFIEVIKRLEMRISQFGFSLKHGYMNLFNRKTLQINVLAQRLNYKKMLGELDLKIQIIYKFSHNAFLHMKHYLSHLDAKLYMYEKLLESYHYQKVLKRGFALVWDASNKIVPSAEVASQKQSMNLEFHDGKVSVMNQKPIKKMTKSEPSSLQHKLF